LSALAGRRAQTRKARRPKVYYRVELAEGILRGAERDPHLHL